MCLHLSKLSEDFRTCKVTDITAQNIPSRHLVNFRCQVFLLLLSQGVEVPSFQQFLETSVYVYPTFAILDFIHTSCKSVLYTEHWFQDHHLQSLIHCQCLLRRSHNHQAQPKVWAVRPTIIKCVAGVSRLTRVLAMPPQSIHAAWPERNWLPPNNYVLLVTT